MNYYPKLKSFAMLLVDNNRSKAYLQNLIKYGYLPDKVILLQSEGVTLPEHRKIDIGIHELQNISLNRKCTEANIEFNERETVQKTINKNKISFVVLPTLDINSNEVVDCVTKLDSEYVLYSGPGGSILRKGLLATGKHFLHVHPGVLPDYKGSTTMYYSLLEKNSVGASVIILKEKIDSGPVLYVREFFHKTTEDLDRVFDPCIRTRTLIEFLRLNHCKNIIPLNLENNKKGRTYYIIHPLLKHISILKHNLL